MAVGQLSQSDRISGYPVSKATAERIYCGLDEDKWWKQLYDGKYHHLGPRVFDDGLHGYQKEPGFYESAQKAFQFAKSHLNEKLTVEFYKELHQVACAHFDGPKTKTRMKASEAGRFRDVNHSGVRCRFDFFNLLDVSDRNSNTNDPLRKKIIQDYSVLRQAYGDAAVKMSADHKNLNHPAIGARKFTISQTDAQRVETVIQKQLQDVQQALKQWDQNPILRKAAPTVSIDADRFRLEYRRPKDHGFSFDEVIPHLFTDFNIRLHVLNNAILQVKGNQRAIISFLARKKLVLIGQLYSTLEWFHPYPDGQGRTDLILLAKLLSENGFTPAILDEPYMSSFSSEEDWIAYLEESMQKWQKEVPSHVLTMECSEESEIKPENQDVYSKLDLYSSDPRKSLLMFLEDFKMLNLSGNGLTPISLRKPISFFSSDEAGIGPQEEGAFRSKKEIPSHTLNVKACPEECQIEQDDKHVCTLNADNGDSSKVPLDAL